MSRRASAFTLLEMTLAMTLVIGLVGMIYSLYRTGMDFREQTEQQLQEITARRAILSRMTEDLRGTLIHPWLREDPNSPEDLIATSGMWGYASEVSFVTAGVPGAEVWLEQNMLDRPVDRECDMHLVTYRMRYNEETGEPAGLVRISRRLLASQPAPTTQERMVSPQVRFFRVGYWNNNDAVWDEVREGGIPMAVEVVLSEQPARDDGSWPLDYARRVVYIPAGRLAMGGGPIIQGNRPGGRR